MPAKILVSTEDMPYADWLEYRKQGIGGSDASVVCGINRYKSPVELWMEKTDQMPSQEAGEAAYWGTQLEPFVRAEFTKRTGIEVIHTMQLLQSEEHPFMLANLDFTDAVQVRQHEGMFLALEQLALVADLDPSALGKLSPDKRLQLRPPVGSFPGFLGRELARLIQPQLHGGLVAADPTDHGCVRTADALLPVLQPVSIGHILGRYQYFCRHMITSLSLK